MKDIAIKENHLYQKAYRNGEKAHTKHLSVYVLRDWGAKKQMLKNPTPEEKPWQSATAFPFYNITRTEFQKILFG